MVPQTGQRIIKLRLKLRFFGGGALLVLLAALIGDWIHPLVVSYVGIHWDFLLTTLPFLEILIVPFWFALDRWVFRPLVLLDQANRKVAQGDLESAAIGDAAIPDGEIGDVIRSRNAMV